MLRLGRPAALATALVALLGAGVRASDHPQDALKLILRDSPGGQKTVYVTRVPTIVLPQDQPFIVGASFTITAQSGETATFDMPADNWTGNASATLYKFTNRVAPVGPSPVKLAIIKDGSALKVTAKACGITLDEPSQGSISVMLTIGSDRYCSTCGGLGVSADEPGRFVARGCAAAPCAP